MSNPTQPPRRGNRLAEESSPYLLQHAHNPVDWYPWGPEAFAAARQQDKPIFLSVGYSSCYWCHVMERQCFENESIAEDMNRGFISIKVDREERPDVDQLYMSAVQVLSGQGGWPMSVFLTPDLKPFHGGTYFPPVDALGRIGFPRLLRVIDEAWKNRRDEIGRTADELTGILRRMAEPQPRPATLDAAALDSLLEQSTADYDPVHAGFGSAPKFPRQTLLELLLVSQRWRPDRARMEQALQTLKAMAAGGIHDHLGGAFHRYSTDDQWLVPHFEIMLYDNALLAWLYAEAFAQTHDAAHAATARGILDFVLREMTSPQGAFYTSFDAEVDGQEGATYLWTPQQVAEALGPDAALFSRVYGLDNGPNFTDPHQGRGVPDQNILYLAEPVDAASEQKLIPLRQKLYALRRQRPQPLLDTKILTSWNALMIRALAHAGKVLSEPRYPAAASRAADYLLVAHRAADGGLHRTSRDGRAKGDGFLDDYAFMIQALLELDRREPARELAHHMCEEFQDKNLGGFFFTPANAGDVIVRQKTASDSPLLSGNAVAASVMLALDQPRIAGQAIAVFAAHVQQSGQGMSAMVQTALQYVFEQGPVSSGSGSAAPAQAAVVSLTARRTGPDALEASVAIAAGYHLNGHQAAPGLTPTRLSVAGEAARQVAAIEYPPAQMRRFPFADEPIAIYAGQISIAVRFKQPVQGPLTLQLHCQPCSEQACLAAVSCQCQVQ
jgi:uncharacterized protein